MKRLSLLIILFAVTSCIYEYDFPDIPQAREALVIDGNIVIGSKATLGVYRLTPSGKPVSTNAVTPTSWWVEDDAGTRYDLDASGTLSLSAAPADRAYRMMVEAEGKTYSSSFQTPLPSPQIDSLIIDGDNPSDVYCLLSFHLDPSVGTYVGVTFEEIWEFHTDFTKNFAVSYDEENDKWKISELEFPDMTHYYCWSKRRTVDDVLADLSSLNGTAVDFLVTQFPRTNNRNHRNYDIKVWARTLSEQEYRFHTTLAQQYGGLNLFTPNPGEIAGNVACVDDPSEYVYGYVSTSMCSTAKKHIGSQYFIPSSPSKSSFEVPDSLRIPEFLKNGYWPIVRNVDNEIMWGPERCVDCVLAGGKLEKPAFSE
ncbi:MAG: DUF4249 domain-containing protein [Bacteroidales bacterium]|nr:DUF4249 domain-containing protein [Bacteroidales bacterium]